MSVVTEEHGPVLVVRLQREEKRNAIDLDAARGIEAALDRLEDDETLRVGVLTGTPAVFSAGTDLSAAADLRMPRGGEYGLIRRERDKPLIAAVEGPALGGGMEIVLACDLVVASTSAVFGLPEVRRGVVATSGALFRTARALPPAVARELLLTGRRLGAQRAHQLGLVNELVAPGRALDEAIMLAGEIVLAAPVSVRETLRALRGLQAPEEARGWELTTTAIEQMMAGPDMAEGIAAFFDRRPPRWAAGSVPGDEGAR